MAALLFVTALGAAAVLSRYGPAKGVEILGWRRPAPTDLLWALLVVGFSVGLGWLALLGIPPEIRSAEGTTGAVVGIGAAVGVVLGATVEELFFRGLLQGLIQARWSRTVGVLTQAIIFLLPHLLLLTVDPRFWMLLPVQFAVGIALGVLRNRSGSVVGPIVAHVATNLIAGLFLI